MGILKKLFGRKQDTHTEPERHRMPEHHRMKVVVHDSRSEEEKRIAEEAARGVGVDPETDKVMQLVAKAYSLGRASGFRVYEAYPQYKQLRSIGKRLHRKGGFEAMQRSYYYIRAQDPKLGSMLNHFWDEIEGWMA